MKGETFGEMVRRARKARGWNQAELAQQVGKSQRAVSTWEQGTAQPEQAVRDRVLEVLGLGNPAAPQAAQSQQAFPGRALVAELPFEWLSTADFEHFTRDLLQARNLGAFVSLVGKSGHTQFGYDVHVTHGTTVTIGVQCKRRARFGPEDVRAAVAAAGAGATGPAPSSVIALSRIASPAACEEIRKFPGWELWDRNDLSQMVRRLEQDRAEAIMKRYFPQMLADFLGVTLGPWLDADAYIDRWHTDKTYNHRWHLVGRTDTVEALTDFAVTERGRIAVLSGPGGSGKTKVLIEACRCLAGHGVPVRVLDHDGDVERAAFEHLPHTGALLIIVDDAHEGSLPLGKVIAGVLEANSGANILVSSRPYGLHRVDEALSGVGLSIGDTLQKKITELDQDAATELAREALDEPVRHLAPRLAATLRDCPLLIVTGATLINRGQLHPSGLEDDERLHDVLTRRLPDALAGPASFTDPRRDVLTALAAYQPVNLADDDARASLQELTGLEFHDLAPHISGLEAAGLVLTRGQTVRVVPDLLGDALLNRAARLRGPNVPTGYLNKAWQSAADAAARNLIINAGRVDWQAGKSGPNGTSMIESLWNMLEAEFHGSDAVERVSILKLLSEVAFFQPTRALKMVEWAIEHPAQPTSKPVMFSRTRTVDDTEVRHAMTPVLHPIAWYPKLLPAAATLLWDLARQDPRESPQHPDHPLRALHTLASFTHFGVTEQQQILIGLVDRWLGRPRTTGDRSPLTVLEPMLATSSHDERWTSKALSFFPYPVAPTPEVLALRHSVMDIAFAQLASTDPATASAAAGLIGAAISIMPAPFGLQIPAELQQAWFEHFQDILNRLRDHLAQTSLSPALLVDIRSRLNWTAQFGPGQLRHSAQVITAAIPATADNTLARALHGGPADPCDDPDMDAIKQGLKNLFTEAIAQMSDWPDEQAADRLNTLLAAQQTSAADAGRARPFLWEAITRRPSLGAAMCKHAISAPESVLGPQLSVTLSAMAQADGPRAVACGRQLLTDGRIAFAREVALAFGLQRARLDLADGEDKLLREMAGHADPHVSAAAVGATRYLRTSHPDLAVDLVFAALPSGGLSEAVWLFKPELNGTLSWAQLPEHRKNAVLQQLTEIPELEHYTIAQLLAYIAGEDPEAVIEVLQNRVQTAEQGRPDRFIPLPHTPWATMPFRQSDRFPDLLRRIREWLAAAPTSPWRQFLGADLFRLVAGPYDDQVLDIIAEYTNNPDPVKMRVVATMLSEAPRGLIWDINIVRHVLRTADRCGQDSLNAVQGALAGAAARGGRNAAVGEPFAEDVEQQTRAQALAASCLRGSVEEQFYTALAESAGRAIAWAVAETDQPDDHRKWS
ncbi:transcriptional regulator with XRE-family HTH domain [Catenulispora sp. EB89]|uniref:helix-turn-helix domain-containing protein n=1 Tax=Catenulispora sp. EB89 TaxID=3156257 RepID=UPI003518D97B